MKNNSLKKFSSQSLVNEESLSVAGTPRRKSNVSIQNFRRKSNYIPSRHSHFIKESNKVMEEKIDEIANIITGQYNCGTDIFHIIIPKEKLKNFLEIIKYILKRDIINRTKNQILVIRHFLTLFPSFLERLDLKPKKYETREILYKIGMYMKYIETPLNEVVFFNGQIGNTFYFILDGEVSVLIPASYSCELTIKEYMVYFDFLLKFNEYELLRLAFDSNKKIINEGFFKKTNEYYKYDKLLDKKIMPETSEKNLSLETYLERFSFTKSRIQNIINKRIEREKEEKLRKKKLKEKLKEKLKQKKKEQNLLKRKNSSDSENNNIIKIYSDNENDENSDNDSNNSENDEYNKNDKYAEFDLSKQHNFILWKYIEVCRLQKGDCFGEIALQKENCKRTATIITTKNCMFGSLQKEEYQIFFKDVTERLRRNNIEGLLKCNLFSGYCYYTFESKLFNCFFFIKHKKGDYLFKQGNKREKLFYIKSGEVQIQLYASFEQLDKIIISLGGNANSKLLKNLIKNNQKLKEFELKKRKFNVSIISKGEIIGSDEIVDFLENEKIQKFNFSGMCVSCCDLFELGVEFFDGMLRERVIRENYEKLVEERKIRLIKRLCDLKKNTILQYFNLIKADENIVISSEFFPDNLKNNNKRLLSLRNKEELNKEKTYSFEENKNINNNNDLLNKSNNYLNYKNSNKLKPLLSAYNSNVMNINKDNFLSPKMLNSLEKTSLFTATSSNLNIKINTTFNFTSLHKRNSQLKKIKNRDFFSQNNTNNNIKNYNNNLNNNFSSKKYLIRKQSEIIKINRSKKNLSSVDKIMKKYNNNELTGLKNYSIPKLLVDQVYIYNSMIDKIIESKKEKKDAKKRWNEFDPLFFDNILYNEKQKLEKNSDKNNVFNLKLNSNKLKTKKAKKIFNKFFKTTK